MKRRFSFAVFFFAAFLTVSSFANDSKLYSYGPEGKNHFAMANDQILVRFAEGLSFEQKSEILAKTGGLKLERTDVLPAPDVSIVRVQEVSAEEISRIIAKLNSLNTVVYANPFLVYEDGTYQGIQDRIIIRLKSDKDLALMNKVAKGFNLSIAERNEFDPLMFVLRTSKESKGNALEIANKLAESNAFDYAEPDFLLLLNRFNTNDSFLGYQWSLNNTGSSIQYNGTPGADMHVFNAWGITNGSSAIKVAVIDEGVDLNHPDLQANLLGGYDATGQGSGGHPSGDDAHGTACAGIIAGVGNNNLGVAGVAYSCKIIPVRIAYSNQQGNWVTSNTWIGNALNWAWQTAGADVLSNSWGGGSSSSTINNAISGAVTNGRGGLGAPVLFAAGNDNGANSYPATVSSTISVIAMSMCYERKNPSSCDGENWWGSNYGAGADIAAPGVKIATTDISGSAGYSTSDYTGTFNGTSSATPNAAGVMALILSANPGLSQSQARYALESTCRKVGSYTYNSNVSGQPNGTWSNDLGYGLVDAYSAVLSVSPQVADDAGISTISAPSGTICATSATPQLTLNNFGSNTLSSVTINYQLDAGAVQTYNWSGSLASASSTTVTLPSVSFSGGSHTFAAWTSNPNGNADNGPSNDDASSTFASASNGVTLTIVLDNYPEETSWQVLDGTTVLAAGGTYGSQPDGSTVVENLCLPDGCFNFVINDAYGDGICCSYGSGSYVLRDDSDNSILASGGNFGSSETTNFCVQSAPSLAALISSSSNVSCNGGSNGSATASASGGTTPYSYAWSNGSTGATATGLATGTYTVTVTDGNSDQATATVTITEPTALSYVADHNNVTCNGANDGSAFALAGGGTAPYSYLWSNGETSFSAVSLAPGTHSVTITDANGCTTGTSFTITEPSALSASTNSSDASCNGGSNGSVNVSANGGTAPYSYSWSNGATSASVSGLSAGTYNVTVTDANGCTTSAAFSVGQPSAISLSGSTVDASCGSATDGSVDLSVSGGTAPYSYAWSNGATTQDLGSVSAGSYSVTVTDANGCSASTSATVGENSTLASSASSTDVGCNGGSDGSASVSASGGSAPYSYSWSNGGTTASISGLSAGSYSVTVTDAAGCTSVASVTVVEPSALSANASGSDISCNDANDGACSVSISGGTAPFSYSWSNGGSAASINGLAAGSYSVTVTDANGCSANSTASVSEPSALSASASGSDALCNGGNGSISLSVSGGTAPYSYNWSNGSNAANLSSVPAGSYSVTVTDANGCTATASVSVSEPSALSLSVSGVDATCETADGSASASVSGGTAPYSFSWSNGGSSSSITGLATGIYNVTVTDANGCTANGSATVSEDCGGCTYAVINSNDFEGGFGIWNSGGGDCQLNANASYASSGTSSVQLRDNSNSSHMTTNNLNLSNVSELTITFSYITKSMDNSNEDFWLQISTNGGSSFTTIEEWNLNDEFQNEVLYNETVVYAGTFTSNTRLRFRCDASGNNDWVYIDDVTISGCQGGPVLPTCNDGIQNGDEEGVDCGGSSCTPCATCSDGIQNGDEEGVDCGGSSCAPCGSNCTYETIDSNDMEAGWGIWIDGGVDCNRSTDATHAYSGTRTIRLRDNSGVGSSATTADLDLTGYDEVTVDFKFITSGMNNGEDFWLQFATGGPYSTIASYITGSGYSNENFYVESVVIPGPFSTNTSFRFRCDASANNDQVFLDDIVISGCRSGAAARLSNPLMEEVSEPADYSLSDVRLYPNPTSDILNIDLELTRDSHIDFSIIDMTGKTVLIRSVDRNEGSNKLSFDMNHLPSGIYMMNVVSDKEMITKRFIIQR